MIDNGVFQLLSRKGRMTVSELVEKINALGFDVDQDDVSYAIAVLEHKEKVALYSLGHQKYDLCAQRPCYEAVFKISNRP